MRTLLATVALLAALVAAVEVSAGVGTPYAGTQGTGAYTLPSVSIVSGYPYTGYSDGVVSNQAVSASFTPPANSVLVALAAAGGGSQTFTSISGGGLSWSEITHRNTPTGNGSIGASWARTGSSPGSMTVTATFGANDETMIAVYAFSGAADPQASLSQTAVTSTTDETTYTPGYTGSVLLVWMGAETGGSKTDNSNTSTDWQHSGSVYWNEAQFGHGINKSTASTPVTLGWTNTPGVAANIGVVEVRAQ